MCVTTSPNKYHLRVVLDRKKQLEGIISDKLVYAMTSTEHFQLENGTVEFRIGRIERIEW